MFREFCCAGLEKPGTLGYTHPHFLAMNHMGNIDCYFTVVIQQLILESALQLVGAFSNPVQQPFFVCVTQIRWQREFHKTLGNLQGNADTEIFRDCTDDSHGLKPEKFLFLG